MKNTIITGIMAVTILLAGCGKKSGPSSSSSSSLATSQSSLDTDQRRVVDTSQVVAYAIADTNRAPDLILTITDIWKGAREAVVLGVTNGLQFSYAWPTNGGPLPQGMIVYYPQDSNPASALRHRGVLFVRSGRVVGMTVQQYRSKFGL